MSMRVRLLAILVAAAYWAPAVLDAQRPNFLLFSDPGRRFSVEFPEDWRWMIISPSGGPLAVFIQPRNEAAVVVEHFRLRQPLAPQEISDLFAQIESDYIRENQPQAADVVATLTARPDRPTIIVNYTRPVAGNSRERERVRQYSFPAGGDLYRVTCMALASQFARYEATFQIVADSLKTAGQVAPPPK